MATSADYTAKMPRYRAKLETKAMPDTFDLLRDVIVDDGVGGFTTTETTVASGECRLRAQGLQPSEQAIAARLGWTIAYAADLPYAVDVTPSDRLIVDGRRMEIGGVVDIGEWSMVKTVIVQEAG